MPEGDTVHLASERLHRALAGECLVRTDFRVPRHATADLSGRIVDRVLARGKHLLFRIESGVTLHTHFKMDGAWHLDRRDAPRSVPAHQIRVVLETEGWIATGVLLASVHLVATADESALVGHLGPDPLGPDWDAAEAARRMRAEPERPIGDVLLDQRVVAGVGNVFRAELCFLGGLHPETPARAVDADALAALVKRVLEANRTLGRQVTTGDLRRGRGRWVYARGGLPCRRCGTPIATGGARSWPARVTYWCPSCQRPKLVSPSSQFPRG